MGPIEIQKILQHRFPFLMVDRVIETEYEKRSIGIKNVSMNEPWVEGHFPGEPVFPGVLIIETMAQVGGLAFYDPNELKNQLKGYLIGVNKVKFVQKVVPGDLLRIEAEVIQKVANMAQVNCTAKVEDKIVASGVLSYAFYE